MDWHCATKQLECLVVCVYVCGELCPLELDHQSLTLNTIRSSKNIQFTNWFNRLTCHRFFGQTNANLNFIVIHFTHEYAVEPPFIWRSTINGILFSVARLTLFMNVFLVRAFCFNLRLESIRWCDDSSWMCAYRKQLDHNTLGEIDFVFGYWWAIHLNRLRLTNTMILFLYLKSVEQIQSMAQNTCLFRSLAANGYKEMR